MISLFRTIHGTFVTKARFTKAKGVIPPNNLEIEIQSRVDRYGLEDLKALSGKLFTRNQSRIPEKRRQIGLGVDYSRLERSTSILRIDDCRGRANNSRTRAYHSI